MARFTHCKWSDLGYPEVEGTYTTRSGLTVVVNSEHVESIRERGGNPTLKLQEAGEFNGPDVWYIVKLIHSTNG